MISLDTNKIEIQSAKDGTSTRQPRRLKKMAAGLICASVMLSGCSTVMLPHIEEKPLPFTCPAVSETENQLCYISSLEKNYIEDAKKLGIERSTYNLATIAAAVVGAVGLTFDAHTDLVLGSGIFAGGIQTVNAYASPAAKQKLLLTSIQQLRCVSSTTRRSVAGIDLKTSPDDPAAAVLVSDSVASIESKLIGAWLATSQDVSYAKVLENIRTTANTQLEKSDATLKTRNKINLEKLAVALGKCVSA
ncbi:hypothetical protein NUH88_03790 [Nisaea acidiphila]|uniref:Uncharacterized protein n=1 Tax=Nisaea acidiphila TaxID=1862145 RepID=A0A9J7AX54_9PROT|nr:hypothetical protein [Nisaea acidiphila]UUX50828.1 hypothetical protein NUH88_03790 [Nisaea acidiphila]